MSPPSTIHEGLREFKMFHRSENGDLSVLLLYTLILLMEDKNYFSGNYLLGERGERDYIDNCFFCGCLPDKSGIKISYFILQDINLYNLYKKIKKHYKEEVKEAYIEAAVVFILKKLLTTLRKENGKGFEHILFYVNGISNNLLKLDNKNINDLKNLYKKNYSKATERNDDFTAIHSTLKKEFNTEIKIYLVLSGDDKPYILNSIANDFEFCTRNDRITWDACRTKTYIKNNIITKERKYRPVYSFTGLQFPV
jgi:hypothetical protein